MLKNMIYVNIESKVCYCGSSVVYILYSFFLENWLLILASLEVTAAWDMRSL